MFQFLFRAAGMFVLALALITAILDPTRSIAASAVVVKPFGAVWGSVLPASLEASRVAVQTYVHPFVWNPLISTLLALPSWLLLWCVAMILLWIGQRRSNPYGRFARR